MPRIGQIGIRCTDLQKSLSFYRDILGFEEFMRLQMDGGQVIILRAGSVDLELIEASPTEEPLEVEGRCGLNHFALFVRTIDETVRDLKAKGVKILSEPTEASRNIWGAFIEGPDGVRIELVQFAGERVGR
jgi:catechol 2,3-dioxygenase-like lactoylglutathione lyase family enzyme